MVSGNWLLNYQLLKYKFFIFHLHFVLQWFVANYTYQLAVSHTQVGIVNVLSSSSSLFTLLLAAVFPAIASDKFSVSKLLSVLVSIVGVVRMLTLTELNESST